MADDDLDFLDCKAIITRIFVTVFGIPFPEMGLVGGEGEREGEYQPSGLVVDGSAVHPIEDARRLLGEGK